ncbi:MAG: PilN domain-containing protein [Parcubacteria group bacterium]
MFKLLTDEERQKVAHEYALRRAIVMLSAFVLVLVAGIIGLLPSYVRSSARQNEALERTNITDASFERGEEAQLQSWLLSTNKKLQVLSPALDTDRPSEYIDRILEQKVVSVHLTGFSWVRTRDNKLTLSVHGVANDRQSLISFENSINSSGHFSEVTLPVSNLAKDRDINFQIKFSPATPPPSSRTP